MLTENGFSLDIVAIYDIEDFFFIYKKIYLQAAQFLSTVDGQDTVGRQGADRFLIFLVHEEPLAILGRFLILR